MHKPTQRFPVIRWFHGLMIISSLVSLFCLKESFAEPFANPGDLQLRHDLEYLADRNYINIPISTWPMSWADISGVVEAVEFSADVDAGSVDVLKRLQRRLSGATIWGEPRGYVEISASGNRSELRSFLDTPRTPAELRGVLEYTGKSFAAKLSVSYATNPDDDKNTRFDGSYVGFTWGNYLFPAGAQERWWGPGHAGSLILSTNARPSPGLMIQRKSALPFKHPWLQWIGPWSAQVFANRLETDRFVSNPYFLGARVVFKPRRSLEIGLSRTAQWGGEGRPEDFDSLFNLLIGRDNRGDGVTLDDEPGNQLAGFDWRYSASMFRQPLTFYGQITGEDEAGGFPSRYLGLFGLSSSLPVRRWPGTLRLNLEYSDTTCQFYEDSRRYNCAYNHPIYVDGYRYRGRSIGHSTDNDAELIALIATYNNQDLQNWSAALRTGTLNRGGPSDIRNTVTSTPADFLELELTHSRPAFGGHLELGLGYQNIDVKESPGDDSDVSFFVEWSTKSW